MSLFKRGLNFISGSISHRKKSNSSAERLSEYELEEELQTKRSFVEEKKSDQVASDSSIPDSIDESKSDDKPLEPKKRTI